MTLIGVPALNWLNEMTKGMDGCLVVGMRALLEPGI